MTVYADSNFYNREYLSGTAAAIPSEMFGHYAIKASKYINQYTAGNIGEEIPECVRMCCCELAELIYSCENGKSAGGVTTEKVGDISVSYESAESVKKNLQSQIKEVIRSWLADSGLLYRGGNLC